MYNYTGNNVQFHTHPMESHQKFLGEGERVFKANILEANFVGGGGGEQNKRLSVGEVWIFSRTAQYLLTVMFQLCLCT